MANIKKNQFITTAPQIDWLTLRIEYKGGRLDLSENYSYKVLDYYNRVFNRIIEITDNKLNEVVATITDQPHSHAIKEDLILIKFHNKLLYTENLKEYITNFCDENLLKICAVSRLDIAVDFQKFANRLEPETFITRFLKGKYVKFGKGKFKLAGKTEIINEQFDTNGSYGKTIHHEYLRFGTSNNGLKYYLYNKSKELQDVKEKPYIRERWEKYGYIENSDMWRLEFSLTSNDIRFIQDTSGEPVKKGKNLIQEKLLIDPQTGEAQKITEYNLKSIECLDPVILEKIWFSLVNKYMAFYHRGNDRKDRNRKVLLFKDLPEYIAFTCERSLIDSSRTDKNFITNMRRTYEDIRNKDPRTKRELEKLISYQIEKRGLIKWAEKKEIENYQPGNPYEYSPDKIPILTYKRKTEAEKTLIFNKKIDREDLKPGFNSTNENPFENFFNDTGIE